MSLQTILLKIAAITDAGKNTAFEMRSVLTDITATFSGSSIAITNTSELTNDGDDSINPFISNLDLSGITFDSVTTNDNTTSNTIEVSGLTTEYIQMDTTAPAITSTPGQLHWNVLEDTLDLHANGVTYQLGQEISPLVRNQTGSLILNGSPVMFSGSLGASGRILMQPAIADGVIPSSYILGIATEDIANGLDGHVTSFGKVRDIDTTGIPYGEVWNEGDILYVSPFTGGTLTNIKPEAPNPQIFMGVVINSHAINGTLFVRPSWRGNLTDLADINGTPLTTTGQFLVWDNARGVFDFTSNINDFTNTNDYTTGATLSGASLEFTRLSGGTYNVDLSSLISSGGTVNTDDYITGGTFNTGTGDLTLTRVSGGTVVENLDGRYLTDVTFEGYSETGTTVSGDLIVTLGNPTGATINIDNITERISLFTTDTPIFPVNVHEKLTISSEASFVGHKLTDIGKSGGTGTWYGDYLRLRNTGGDTEGGTTGHYIDVRNQGTGDALYQYGSDTISRWSGSGDVGFLNGQTVRVMVDGTNTSSVSTIMRGVSPNVKLDNPNATVAGMQGMHPTIEMIKGTVSGATIMFLDYDITNDPSMVIDGDIDYIKASDDGLEALTVTNGNKRFIRYTGLQQSDFGGIINVTSDVSTIEGATEKVLVTKEWVTGFTSGFTSGSTTNTDDYTTGATLSGTSLEFTRLSGGTYNVDLSSLISSGGTGNDYVNLATFNTSNGDLTLTRLSGGTVVENLDGRYLTGFTDNDDYTTEATLSGTSLEFTRLSGGTFNVELSGLTSSAISKYSETFGDNSATGFTITHSLGTEDVSITIKRVSSGEIIITDMGVTDGNNISIDFTSAPTTDEYRVTIIG